MNNLDKIVKLLYEEVKIKHEKNPQLNQISIMYSIFKILDRKWSDMMSKERFPKKRQKST